MSDLPVEAIEDAPAEMSDAAATMRAARKASGLSLKDIATTTRVPLRHLQALEEGDYGSLPGMTYCAGFARAYARSVGLDEGELVNQIRQEISEAGGLGQDAYEFEEAVNPARIPPSRLVWTAVIIVILFGGAWGIWRMQMTTPPTDEQFAAQSVDEAAQAAQQGALTPPPPPAAPTGPVVMTAADDVWLRIYQPDGTRLYEGTLKRGESYTVPDNARDPMILTGRPDALAVTVGGQAVPPLGTAEKTISDVPISAAALLGRGQAPVAPADNGAMPAVGNVSVPGPAPIAPPRPALRPANSARVPAPAPTAAPAAVPTAPASGATP